MPPVPSGGSACSDRRPCAGRATACSPGRSASAEQGVLVDDVVPSGCEGVLAVLLSADDGRSGEPGAQRLVSRNLGGASEELLGRAPTEAVDVLADDLALAG